LDFDQSSEGQSSGEEEFDAWNLGQEPSLEPARQPQPAKRNQKQDAPRPSVNIPQSDNMSTGEPFTIDTSHYNTSRVVINPPTLTEPTYELEKKGHTSVIRVSYPGPETVQAVVPDPVQSFNRQRDSPSSVHRLRDSPSTHHRPSLPLRSDSAMGLESFHFVAVLAEDILEK